jgi:hypothetical protein
MKYTIKDGFIRRQKLLVDGRKWWMMKSKANWNETGGRRILNTLNGFK